MEMSQIWNDLIRKQQQVCFSEEMFYLYVFIYVLYTYVLFQPILSKDIMKGQNVRDSKCKSVFSSIAN